MLISTLKKIFFTLQAPSGPFRPLQAHSIRKKSKMSILACEANRVLH
jgi:hypothetical protein